MKANAMQRVSLGLAGFALVAIGASSLGEQSFVVLRHKVTLRNPGGNPLEVEWLIFNPHMSPISVSSSACSCSIKTANGIVIPPLAFGTLSSVTRTVSGSEGNLSISSITVTRAGHSEFTDRTVN